MARWPIANGNNYYKYQFAYQYTSSAGVTTSYSTSTNTISCNHGAVFSTGRYLCSGRPQLPTMPVALQLPSSLTANNYILVQVIGNDRTQTFTVLTQ